MTSNYLSVFMADAWRATDRLIIGFSGRFNYAQMDRSDLNGNSPTLTVISTYSHFNPAVGASYAIEGSRTNGGSRRAIETPLPDLGCTPIVEQGF
ncbi:TonB-dependent receptor domain-containing protein [Bradyrhizobium oligotrophicum]|uniref:TonB-dependent receptor domain-containing protein n=1 Tax=Bradyrhizobium oligotrophicum TaxID=44255 RepID=UPI003EB72CDF